MSVAAAGVSCYQASLSADSCDFWQTTLNHAQPDNLWYRFIVHDGTATAYYADNTAALDGGLGATTADAVDNSYALMFYDARLLGPSLGGQRRHLPDLPGPLPQRPRQQRPAHRRPALRRSGA